MRPEKTTIVEDLSARLNHSPFLIVTEYTGMNVLQFSELRSRLAGAGAQCRVVKNTFLRRAAAEVGYPDLADESQRPDRHCHRRKRCLRCRENIERFFDRIPKAFRQDWRLGQSDYLQGANTRALRICRPKQFFSRSCWAFSSRRCKSWSYCAERTGRVVGTLAESAESEKEGDTAAEAQEAQSRPRPAADPDSLALSELNDNEFSRRGRSHTSRAKKKMVPRRGPRLRILKCSEASERDDTERKKKWQIRIK